MIQSTITKKQQEIIQLIYRYRFVDRKQLQALMHLKDKKRLSVWLKDLREQHYIEWIYSTDFLEKTKPAIYYMGLNGIRYLRGLDTYPIDDLRKRYKESLRRPDFIERCILIAGACVNLHTPIDSVSYAYVTEADYANPESDHHFLAELKPQLCFVKSTSVGGSVTATTYLLDVFVASSPRYVVRRRLKDYIEYLEGSDWKEDFATKPIVLIACPTKVDLIYAKRRTRTLLEEMDKSADTHIRFATSEDMKYAGVTATIWEEA
jgi:hypothetical protein